MKKLTAYFGILALIGSVVLTSCVKDDAVCKVCSYTQTDGSAVSLGQLCGDEYKTVESSGYLTDSGVRPVTCN